MKPIVRLATMEDAGACADIHMRSWIFAYSHCVPMELIEKKNAERPALWARLLENNQGTHYVAVCGNQVVGFIGIGTPRDEDLPVDSYEIRSLYLDPNDVGKGYGKALMDWAKAETAARGYRSIALWVLDQNSRAKTFYEACGFQPDGAVKPSGLGDTMEERYFLHL